MLFLRMPDSEKKRSQERRPDLQILAMQTTISRRRARERHGAWGRICDAPADLLAGEVRLLGQDRTAENCPIEDSPSLVH